MSRLLAIARKDKKRAPMEVLSTVAITNAAGVEGDFRGKPGNRQITVLSKAAWESACQELGKSIDWTVRRANLLIDDVDLQETAGKKLVIGDVELLITEETDPCKRMKEFDERLYQALEKDWRGGVCCRVIKSGVVKVGDSVELK